jgi:hypothetical protein
LGFFRARAWCITRCFAFSVYTRFVQYQRLKVEHAKITLHCLGATVERQWSDNRAARSNMEQQDATMERQWSNMEQHGASRHIEQHGATWSNMEKHGDGGARTQQRFRGLGRAGTGREGRALRSVYRFNMEQEFRAQPTATAACRGSKVGVSRP